MYVRTIAHVVKYLNWITNDEADHTGPLSPPLFTSRSEQLYCELLYRTPALCPRMVASRTFVLMRKHSNRSHDTTTDNDDSRTKLQLPTLYLNRREPQHYQYDPQLHRLTSNLMI
jgi:hypothetical protein